MTTRPAVTRSSLYLRRYRYSTRSPSVVGPWPFRLPTNSKPPHAVKNRYSRRGVWMEADRIVKTPYLNISLRSASVAADTQQPLESEDASDL